MGKKVYINKLGKNFSESFPTVPSTPVLPFYLAAPTQPFHQSAPLQPFIPLAPMPIIDGRHPSPTFSPSFCDEPGTSVYVRGLADDVDDDKLRKEFKQYGRIVDAKVNKLTALFTKKLFRKTTLIFVL